MEHVENEKQAVDSSPIVSITTLNRSRPNAPMERQTLPDKMKSESRTDRKILIEEMHRKDKDTDGLKEGRKEKDKAGKH